MMKGKSSHSHLMMIKAIRVGFFDTFLGLRRLFKRHRIFFAIAALKEMGKIS